MSVHISIHGQGKPLVLMHGWGFDSRVWSPLIPKLIYQYQLFLVDLPGFGRTSYLSWENFMDELLPKLPSQFAIAGWSMGGLYATKLALSVPQRISHLINIASSPCFIKNQDWPGIELHTLNAFYELLNKDPHETLRKFMTLQLSGQHNVVSFPEQIPSEEALRHGLDVLVKTDLRQAITEIQHPVLYLFGRLDRIVPSATKQQMQQKFPEFEYFLFKKAAHAIFLSDSDNFIERLESFIL